MELLKITLQGLSSKVSNTRISARSKNALTGHFFVERKRAKYLHTLRVRFEDLELNF